MHQASTPKTGPSATPAGQPPRILVYVGLDLIGDGLMKLPFVRALRHAFPTADITWLAGKGPSAYRTSLAPLVKGLLTRVVDEANIGSSWFELLSRPLPQDSFDLVFDTQRRFKTAAIVSLIRTRFRISPAAGYFFSTVKPADRQAKSASMVRQLLDLLELATGEAANPQAPLPLERTVLALASSILPQGYSYIAMAPGAGGKHKIWPLKNFIEVGQALASNGHVPVYLLGPDEVSMRRDLASAVPEAMFPLQHPAVEQFGPRADVTIAIAGRCRVGLANDSGGGHLLAAASLPMVSLFGPTDPAKFAPLTPRLTVLQAQRWGGADMARIPSVDVLHALNELLAPSR